MPKFKFILPIAVAAVLVVGVLIAQAMGPTKLEKAYDSCEHSLEAASAGAVELADGGHTILIDTSDDSGDYFAAECLIAALDIPASTRSNIDHTTSMMGRQTDEHDGITLEWSYHPDNGLIMTITDN